jgi:hypothetical protein
MAQVRMTRYIEYPGAIRGLGRAPTVAGFMRQAGAVVNSGQKRLCPVAPVGDPDRPSGTLRSHISTKVGEDGQSAYADAGVFGDEVWVFVEVPTSPHVIESHGPWPLRNRRTGQVFGPKVNHPGTQAQPFIRPGLGMLRGRVFKA